MEHALEFSTAPTIQLINVKNVIKVSSSKTQYVTGSAEDAKSWTQLAEAALSVIQTMIW